MSDWIIVLAVNASFTNKHFNHFTPLPLDISNYLVLLRECVALFSKYALPMDLFVGGSVWSNFSLSEMPRLLKDIREMSFDFNAIPCYENTIIIGEFINIPSTRLFYVCQKQTLPMLQMLMKHVIFIRDISQLEEFLSPFQTIRLFFGKKCFICQIKAKGLPRSFHVIGCISTPISEISVMYRLNISSVLLPDLTNEILVLDQSGWLIISRHGQLYLCKQHSKIPSIQPQLASRLNKLSALLNYDLFALLLVSLSHFL